MCIICILNSSLSDNFVWPYYVSLCRQCGTERHFFFFRVLPKSMHPSTGPQGWHIASPEHPCCRVYGTWVCTEALHSLWCRAGCASRVSLLSVPRRGWLLSALCQQGLSLLRQGAETQVSAWDNQIWSVESCWLRRQPSSRVGFWLQTGAQTDEWDSRCNLSCHFFKVLLEVQHPAQAHAMVLWRLLKQHALVIDNTSSSRVVSLLLRW